MALLFKGGEQLFREAMDLVGRKEFSAAKKKFQDAEEKGYDGDGLGPVYRLLIAVGESRGNKNNYVALAGALRNVKCSGFKFGLTDIEVADLITEAELDVKEIDAASIDQNNYEAKSQALIAVAGEFMAGIGDKPLKIDEIFKGNTVSTGNREGLILQAQAYYILGTGTVAKNPKTAADYMQMSYNFRRQIGDSGEEELRLSQAYARSCTCWICGRPANGEGIHFRPMRSNVGPVFKDMISGDAVKPISEDASSVYVCMPCFSAISYRSDDISKKYYDKAIADLRATEARLQAEIAALRLSSSFRR